MKFPRGMPNALGICAVAVALGGCGGSTPSAVAPGTVSQGHITQSLMTEGTPLPPPPPAERARGWLQPNARTGLLYMADEANSQIDIFPLAGNQKAQLGMITDGIETPYGLWSDRHKMLYVANEANNTVTKYKYGATTPVRTYTQGLHRPLCVITDKYGDLFVGNAGGAGNGTVIEYLGGSTNHYLVLQTPGVEADGLALDQQGNLYVAYRTSPLGPGSIDEFAPFATEGTVLGMTLNQPQGVIVDNTGNVVTVETGGTNRIDVFPPGSQTASLELPMPQENTPTQLAIDSKETFLYVSSFTNSAVYRAAYPLPNELLLKDAAVPRIQGTTITNNQAP